MRLKSTIRMSGLLVMLTLAACSQQQHESADAPMTESTVESAAMDAAPSSAPVAKADVANAAAQLDSSAATYTDDQRQFIRTANVEFRVRDVYRSALAIEDIVAAQGGFVTKNDIRSHIESVQSRPGGDGNLIELATYTTRGTLQVRVPSAHTQRFLRAIVTQVEFLDRRQFEAVDAQFELLRQQLTQQRNQEAQQALGEATAEGSKLGHKADAIAERNDAKAGRDEALIAQKTFEDRVAFAIIDLSLYQPPQIRRTERLDVDAVMRREGPGFFARAGHALSMGWYGLLTALVALLKLWPLWLVLLAVGLLGRRLRRGDRGRT